MFFTVGVIQIDEPIYPSTPPYNPDNSFPEYPFKENISKEKNYIYSGIRELLFTLGLDREHYNTPEWNPFGDLIKPGMTVVIKPNFVLSRHFEGKDIYSIITHPSIIRVIADYCWIALKGKGKIIIADAPQYNCNFNELIYTTKLDKVIEFFNIYKNVKVELIDLRDYWSKSLHLPSCIRRLSGDPLGSARINLGKKSLYYNKKNIERFYGAVYHRWETIKHHTEEIQEYDISKTILSADVFISVPKMKVHKKVGVTLNAKGLVGIATNKNLIVHYSLGTPKEGGDQFPDNFLSSIERKVIHFERWCYDFFLSKRSIFWEIPHRLIYGFFYLKILKKLGLDVNNNKRLLDAGNWWGNDTAWRMCVDLMRIIHFSDKFGILQNTIQRRFFSIIDGVVGGENKGPLVPDPKPVGVLIGGDNLLAVDLVATRLMGFDPLKLKQYKTLLDQYEIYNIKGLEDILVITPKEKRNTKIENCLMDNQNKFFDFRPYPGWLGHIEIGGGT